MPAILPYTDRTPAHMLIYKLKSIARHVWDWKLYSPCACVG